MELIRTGCPPNSVRSKQKYKNKLRHNNALDRTCGGACVAGPSCAARTVHSTGKYVIERER